MNTNTHSSGASDVAGGAAVAAAPVTGPLNVIDGRSLYHVETDLDHPDGAGIHVCSLPKSAQGHANALLMYAAPDLLEIAMKLALSTDEGDDAAQGTHYVDKQGVIRCKDSFLDLIERTRAAIAKATGDL